MRPSRSGSTAPRVDAIPQIPHMRPVYLRLLRDRLAQHAEARGHDRAYVELHRAIGDPLQVVRELLGHRRLVAPSHLCEASQAGTHDEPLPVRRQIVRQLGEEARADRTRPDERHVAAQDVPELRDLVELRRLEPPADTCQLRVGVTYELVAEVLPDSLLGAGPERAVLEHLEEATAAPDTLPAVEHRASARCEDDAGDQQCDG